MKALLGFALSCACACTEPRVPPAQQSVPFDQSRLSAPADATQPAQSPEPVPGMPPWLAGKLPSNRVPWADNAYRDIPEGPQVAITKQQVLVDGEVVATTQEVQRHGRPQKLAALFQYLRQERERVKAAQPGSPFPGVVVFWVDIETSALVLKSAFQLAAYSGYPNGFFVARDRSGTGFKALPIDAPYPPRGSLPPEVIQGTVRSSYAKIRECYDAGLARNPDLNGALQIRFVIDSEGMVQILVLESATLPDDQVNQCVVEVFSSLQFPKPEGGFVNVVYPLKFGPGDAAP